MQEDRGFPFDFGFEGAGVSLSDARVAVLFLTEDDGRSLGVKPGPGAVADASQYVEFFEMRGEVDALDIGVFAELTGATDPADVVDFRLKQLLAQGIFPVIVAEKRLALPSGYGSTVAMWGKIGREEGEGNIQSDDADTLLVGLRAASQQGFNRLASGVTIVTSETLCRSPRDFERIVHQLKSPVHLSIDYDVFAPSVVDTERASEPGGLGWYDFVFALETIFAGPGVKSVDVVGMQGVEPKTRSALIGAQIITKILALLQVTQAK